jgi:ABC-type branched-subunit amino acid transport system substrate-binding protein
LTAALCLSLVACSSGSPETADEIRIGLLLPYTGKDGSAGANYERGVLMAADQVNRAGGLYGKPLRIVYGDTHSTVERGLEEARSLVHQGVVAIIGPENDELARELSPILEQADVSLVTPSSSSVASSTSSDFALWFRLAPSGRDLGIALARNIKSKGAKRVAVVSTNAEYELAFASGVKARLADSGLPNVASQTISSGAASFSASIQALVDAAPDAIVLAADASTGSRFVNEFAVLVGSTGVHWYLSPTLEEQAFVLNAFPDIVEGMVGVAPAVSDNDSQTDAFSGAFVERWKGLTPTTGAYFYYDALALFAIAFNGAASENGSATPPSDSVRAHMLSASGQSGLVVEWDELDKGISEAADGTAVYYSGLTGVISLDRSGARSTAYTRFWTISGGDITSLTK